MRLLVVGRQPGPPTPGCVRSLVPQEPPATDAGSAPSALLAYAAPGAVVVARLGSLQVPQVLPPVDGEIGGLHWSPRGPLCAAHAQRLALYAPTTDSDAAPLRLVGVADCAPHRVTGACATP